MRSSVSTKLARALVAASMGFAAACSQTSKRHDADAELKAIYTAEWTWREAQFPDDEDSQKPIADHLPDVGPAAQDARLKYWLDVERKLGTVVRADLSPQEQLNYDIYRPQIEVLIANQRFRDFEMPANSDTSFWSNLGYTARRPFRNLKDYRNWIAQMRDIPRYFNEQIDEMRRGLKRGFTPPRVTMAGRDASLTAVTDATPEGSLFYTPFKDMPGVSDADKTALREQAIAVIRDTVQPAYRDLLTFMRTEYVPGTRASLAAYDLPDGKSY